MNLFLIALN